MKEMDQRLVKLLVQEPNDRNLIKAINTRVLPVITYAMNVCTFTTRELAKLDMTVKRALRERRMHGPPIIRRTNILAKGVRVNRTQDLSRYV